VAKHGRPLISAQVDTTLRWIIDGPPRAQSARQRSLAAALRSATGVPRVPRALVADLLTAVGIMARPENPTRVLRTITGPLAAPVHHALVDRSGSRPRLANWDLDF